jgi:hypothetical protein
MIDNNYYCPVQMFLSNVIYALDNCHFMQSTMSTHDNQWRSCTCTRSNQSHIRSVKACLSSNQRPERLRYRQEWNIPSYVFQIAISDYYNHVAFLPSRNGAINISAIA